MCLAVPVKVEKLLADEQAVVELSGVKTTISTALVEDITEGDYVILHVGFALSKLSEEEALKTLALIKSGSEGELK